MVVALVSGEREELGGPDTDAEAAARVTLLPATGQPEVTHLFTGECSKVNPPPTSTPLTPHTGYLQGNHAQNTFTYSQVSVSSCQFWFVQSKCVVVNIFGEGGGRACKSVEWFGFDTSFSQTHIYMYVTPFTCMTPNMKFCHVNMAQSRKIDPSLNQIILLNFWFGFLSEWAN